MMCGADHLAENQQALATADSCGGLAVSDRFNRPLALSRLAGLPLSLEARGEC
ncbi:hypothetical protein U5801_22110 [Lamprobacter modestohalophilus]|uniref:hypothetical protein n=1 Tax=Lamprobacter modestohalophilus TaxID=1064514 RepID=UPI002ADEDD37|nr:hypothetical protein [Lamprobacter modestohalophilus]MEA1052478.1 hypothetical protein [Lamprobacter modestohalophilus]